MTYLVLGLLLWSVVHMVPAVPMSIRAWLIGHTDAVVYKGIFALLIVVAVASMVVGWKASSEELAFTPQAWGRGLNLVAMLVASVLFLGPYIASNVKRMLRHPQLTGVILWGVGHIVASGQWRGIVLFGGLAAWALVEIALLNRRDGVWAKPAPVSRMADFRLVVAGVMFFAVFMFTHKWLFGVAAIPEF